MTSAEAAEATERALAGISAAALLDDCGLCWKPPGEPCVPGGVHVARLARAMRHGFITSADLSLALDTLGVFTEASVLYAAEAVPA